MKRLLYISLISIALFSACSQSPTKEDLQQLKGYWEIKTVESQSGKKKTFSFNESVDYIFINEDLNGFRTKVKPDLEGKYTKTGTRENLKIDLQNDSIFIHYNTPQAAWKESLLKLDKNSFTVKNKRGLTYTYQRFNGYLSHE
ncbi:MAG: lipocalin family protein [Mesonia hippocampi]|uniref:lipocalin family protein n=1 Tax=Mesonia hippocampi TaxID=1628250 RepID=UPI003F9433AB